MSLSKGLICILKCETGHTHAIVKMYPLNTHLNQGVIFNVSILDLPPGYRAFHVHETGNLLKGCETLGPHYNPTNKLHGDLNDPNAHLGDLGNIFVPDNGKNELKITSNLLFINELLGRSLVIHANIDDLGRGNTPESQKTGSSGARLCCGVIGYL
jgi:superoxide dismutase, Cu-Zn family